ncbi:MAG: hypothetical protein MJ138_08020, partial [Kiritimatiellae bacterium]|nr:hypothetical protein [Kiritimatiellia bacterium]
MKKLTVGFVAAAVSAAVFADTTADYVRDGLVAFWDGVENAGAGAHAVTNLWRDVVGGHAFKLENAKVEADRVTFAGAQNSYGVLAASNTVATFCAATNGTVEIVLAAEQAGDCVALQSAPASGVTVGSYRGGTIVSCNVPRPMMPWAWKKGETNTVSILLQNGAAVSSFTNGLPLALDKNRCDQWGAGGNGTTIGNRHQLHTPFKGAVYAIRVYNRQLTADEAAFNRAADARRFLEGDLRPRTTAFEVAGDPEPLGAPVPDWGLTANHKAGEKIACAFPAWTNAAQTLATRATGWKLVDTFGKTVAEGAGAACDCAMPDPVQYRRLVWTVEKTPLKRYRVSPSNDLAKLVKESHDHAVFELENGVHELSETVAISNEIAIVGAAEGGSFVRCAQGAPFFVDHKYARVENVAFMEEKAQVGPRGGRLAGCLVFLATAQAGFGGGPGVEGGFAILTNRAQMARDPAEWKPYKAPYAAYDRVENTISSTVERVVYAVADGQDVTRWSINRCWTYRGEIDLPAGATSFMLPIDDYGTLWLDGKRVLETNPWWRGDCTVVHEKAGWHSFRLALFNERGSAGPCDEERLGFAIHGFGEKWRVPEESRFRRLKRGALLVAAGEVPDSATYPRPGTYAAANGQSNLACRATSVVTNETTGVAYRIKGWRVTAAEGGAVLAEGEGASATVALDEKEPRALAWTWEPIAYLVQAAPCKNGTIEPQRAWVKSGGSLTVRALPDEGCWFSSWTKGVDPTYKLEEEVDVVVDKPTTVSAEFFKRK